MRGPGFGPEPKVIFTTGSPKLPWHNWAKVLLVITVDTKKINSSKKKCDRFISAGVIKFPACKLQTNPQLGRFVADEVNI